MYRKSQEISSPQLKPFSVESRKTSRGGRFAPPPTPVIGLKGLSHLSISFELREPSLLLAVEGQFGISQNTDSDLVNEILDLKVCSCAGKIRGHQNNCPYFLISIGAGPVTHLPKLIRTTVDMKAMAY